MNEWKVTVLRSDRKTMSLQIKPDGSLVVRAPRRLPEREIRNFLQEKSAWIERTLAKVKEANRAGEEAPLSPEDIRALADRALEVIPPRVKSFASQMGVTYGCITIRNQQGRWGSCSSVGNLNFNCLLMLAPPEVLDSVVVHELCHRKEMNHSARFYAEVLQVFPDYRKWDQRLKDHGSELMARMV